MKNWKRVLRQRQKQGLIRGFTETAEKKNKIPSNSEKRKSKALDYIKWNIWYWANEQGLELIEEYRFFPERKWRFDFAFPSIKLAVEFEGGIHDRNGGHTSFKDFNKDVDKYNAAQGLGWKVIRFTAYNYQTLLTELNKNVAA